jgi:hypothetical protein
MGVHSAVRVFHKRQSQLHPAATETGSLAHLIYDPRRRALEVRQRIIESMGVEELEDYAKSLEPQLGEEQPPKSTPANEDSDVANDE